MTIKRRGVSAISSGNSQKVAYCLECAKVGRKEKLQARIYTDEQGNPRTPDSDFDKWRQCYRCGLIFAAAYEVKEESEIEPFVQISDNPHRSKGETKGISNNRIGKNKRGKNEYDYITDPDLKAELKEGSQLISYSDSSQF